MNSQPVGNGEAPPLPDKRIPLSVAIIGTYEVAAALFGLIILVLFGSFGVNSLVLLVLLLVYGAMGAGLWAIYEWARRLNVILHVLAIPFAVYTAYGLGGPTDWRLFTQIIIALAIVLALTRPEIRHKFQTARSKGKKEG
ncbi:MAG: hypothetical protein D6784_13255 [Chloroflexi bacterium]|nr:MAG: hypothetical protein D6784_13255 [Chloroflexota bacterium]